MTETRTIPKSRLTNLALVLRVNDLPRSVQFYRDQLGFEVEFNYEDFYAGMRREGCSIHLKGSGALQRDQARFEANEEVDALISVVGVEDLYAHYADKGMTFTVTLRQMPYGTEFYVKDPDGYILGFVQAQVEEAS